MILTRTSHTASFHAYWLLEIISYPTYPLRYLSISSVSGFNTNDMSLFSFPLVAYLATLELITYHSYPPYRLTRSRYTVQIHLSFSGTFWDDTIPVQ